MKKVGRPREYHEDRPATGAERQMKYMRGKGYFTVRRRILAARRRRITNQLKELTDGRNE